MTREEEIEAVLAGYGLVIIKNPAPSTGGAAIMAAMLEYGQQRADAEAAAMRERAGERCERMTHDFLEVCNNQANSEDVRASAWAKATACNALGSAIRALPTTEK